jgi:hypothetical protein
MSQGAWWEEDEEDGPETPESISSSPYKFFNTEDEGGDIVLLNFSESGGYFPDYTAELVENGETEIWEVNTEEGSLEQVSIEPDYVDRYELASKLQESYEELTR